MATAPSIGRTLARLADLAPRHAASDVGPADSRALILQLIRERTDAPVSVEWLCEQTDLHANTVRGHLEVLVAAGEVVREPGRSSGRGRPPMLYRAGEDSELYRQLARALAKQLDDSTDPELIAHAAERWADAIEDNPPASSVDEAVAQAVAALDQLGFAAQASPIGDSVTLRHCPYADLIRDQPVICDIHTALLGDLLDRTGQPVAVGDMEVWAAPGMCRAHLTRADRTPARVIPGTPEPEPTTRRGPTKKNRK